MGKEITVDPFKVKEFGLRRIALGPNALGTVDPTTTSPYIASSSRSLLHLLEPKSTTPERTTSLLTRSELSILNVLVLVLLYVMAMQQNERINFKLRKQQKVQTKSIQTLKLTNRLHSVCLLLLAALGCLLLAGFLRDGHSSQPVSQIRELAPYRGATRAKTFARLMLLPSSGLTKRFLS